MKNKKTIIIVVSIVIFVTALITIGVLVFDHNRNLERGNIQRITDNKIKDIKFSNGLKLTKGNIEKQNNIYYVSMSAINDTKEDIDMRNYRISFRDEQNEEIDWFNGNAIGIVEAGSSVNFIIESYNDLSKTKTINYEVFNFGE